MEYKDYYKTLGVSKSASEKEIKSAYRKLARKHHPDVNQDDKNAEARFKEINEAYEVLSDSSKRAKYDQLGSNWNQWQQRGSPGNFNWGDWMGGAGGARTQQQNARYATAEDLGDLFGSGGGGFSDFFTTIFGGMAGAQQQQRGRTRSNIHEFGNQSQKGQNIEHELEIALTEAYYGTSRQISINGRKLEVKIPAGAKTGTKVRVRGEGNPGFGGGPSGDLYLKMKVSPDPRFERKGDNLQVDIPVDLYTAVLGGEVRVPTMNGDINLKIPAGSQNGQKMRLRGKGMPKLRKSDEHGDMYVKINVRLPKTITDEQRELFEQLRQLEK